MTVKRQTYRIFCRDRLPAELLADPRYWEERECDVFTRRALSRGPAEEDIVLIE